MTTSGVSTEEILAAPTEAIQNLTDGLGALTAAIRAINAGYGMRTRSGGGGGGE